MTYRQVSVIAGGFKTALRAIAVDRQGLLYAAGDSEVRVYDAAGKLRRDWGTTRPGLSVAVERDGTVWVGELRQMEIFDGAGKLKNTWRDEKLLNKVTAVGFAIDRVLAADAAERTIRCYDRTGKFLHNIGKDNPTNGFLIPGGILDFAVDAHDVIHAANPGKHRVEQYAVDGKLLGRIGKFSGTDPAGFTGCCNPINVAVADGVYVTEKAGPRAKVYNFDGKLRAVIAGDVFDAGCKYLSVAADARGRVYVADSVKRNIHVFEAVKA